ncbi:MAG: hypothetical protein ACJ76H_16120, partial [Bacteriovoracaceae bacterium]
LWFFWGPIVYIPGAFTYSLSSYVEHGVLFPRHGIYFPFSFFFVEPFMGLLFIGTPLSFLIAIIYNRSEARSRKARHE